MICHFTLTYLNDDHEVVFSTNGRFPFRGGRGGLRKMVTSFLFLAMLNFLNDRLESPTLVPET